MLKQTLLATAATTVLLGSTAAFAVGGSMGSGTITFSGSITEAPCSIVPGDTNLTIDLGQISQKALKAANSHSDSVPVNIHLASCTFEPDTTTGDAKNPNGLLSKVGVTFNGGIATGSHGYISNTGTATQVTIQLLQADNITPVDFTTSGRNMGYTEQMQNGGTNNMVSFFARLISEAGSATPGTVSGSATYTLAYF